MIYFCHSNVCVIFVFTKYSKTSLIRTPLNQTSLNPDSVPDKINFYFGPDNGRINHRCESEVTAGF
jgi:hypothetical protein